MERRAFEFMPKREPGLVEAPLPPPIGPDPVELAQFVELPTPPPSPEVVSEEE